MTSDIQLSDDTLRISRYFSASPARVFKAWTDPTQLNQWWGCSATTSVQATVDLKVGGGFKADMKGSTYGELVFSATYDEIVENEKLVYSMSMSPPGGGEPMVSKVTVEFVAEDDGTRLKLTHVGLMPGVGEHIGRGTTDSLDKLERLVAAEPAAA